MRTDKNVCFTKERRGFESSSLGSRNENRRPAQYGGFLRIGAVVGWALLLFAGVLLSVAAQEQTETGAKDKPPEISEEVHALLKEWQEKRKAYEHLLEEAYQENPALRLAAQKINMFKQNAAIENALANQAEKYFLANKNSSELRGIYNDIKDLYSSLEIYHMFRSPLHADIFEAAKKELMIFRVREQADVLFGGEKNENIKNIYNDFVDPDLVGKFPSKETDDAQSEAVAAWWMRAMEMMEDELRRQIRREVAKAGFPEHVEWAARYEAMREIPRQLYEFYHKKAMPNDVKDIRNELDRLRHVIGSQLPNNLPFNSAVDSSIDRIAELYRKNRHLR